MPVVMVRSKPKGFPMAMSFCPTFSLSESPKGMVLSSTPAGGSNFRTAMSLAASVPTTRPSYWVPSDREM